MSTVSDPNSAAHRLLTYIAIAGDFPTAALSRVLGDSRYRERVITTLRQKRFITTHAADGLYAYRLTSAGRAYLLSTIPERCSPFLIPPSAPKSEYRRRVRNHRVCESYIFMEAAGVQIFPDLKPWPFAAHLQPGSAAYYGAREVRACNPEAAKIKNARFAGVLRAPSGPWLVYNTGDSPMKWEPRAEQRSKAYVSQSLGAAGTLVHLEDIMGMMLGRDMDCGYQLLTSNGGAKRAYFRVDSTFSRFPFLPLNDEGALALKLILDPALDGRLRQILLAGQTHQTNSAIELDGYDGAGNPLLLAYDFDLRRISNFLSGLYLHGLQGAAICFDFQAPTLRKYFGDKATVQAIDHQKLERRLFYT